MPAAILNLIQRIGAITQHAVDSTSAAGFLSVVAESVRSGIEANAVVIMRAAGGGWSEIARSADPSSRVAPPTHLASEALDRERPVADRDWTACPIAPPRSAIASVADPIVLLVQRAVPSTVSTLIEPLSHHIGSVLQLLERHLDHSREIRRLASMLAICQDWYQTTEMEPLLARMAEAATELLDADRASIFLWDKPNHTLVARPALGMAGGELRVPDDAGIVGDVVQRRTARTIDAREEPGQINRTVDKKTGYTTNTILCVPLVTYAGDCLGAFEVLNKRKGRFTQDDQEQLAQLAKYAAQALDQTQQWERLIERHQKLVEQAAAGTELIGECQEIEALRSSIARIADTDLAVLLLGPNGTGKEVVARQLHFNSRRRESPFIAVNCAALAETLLESELFGHEKGAFTDAHDSRAGKFELASGGTLFLDEIGDMSPSGQAKLLRVLEDKKVVRVGGATPIHTDVRIVAATNQNLAELVKEGRFRKDLYFRLNVVLLELPPLVERGDDVLLLAERFLSAFCRTIGRRVPKFTAAARKRLLSHAWPGNVRELKNQMERLAYLSTEPKIDADDLAFTATAQSDSSLASIEGPLSDATREFQVRYIDRTLDRARGNMSEAARILGLHRSNLYRKMRQLGMAGAEDSD